MHVEEDASRPEEVVLMLALGRVQPDIRGVACLVARISPHK
jgi:hypothetical protein